MSKDQRHTAENDERIRRLITAGTELLGGSAAGAASAAMGFLVAGPAGAAVGGTAAAAISMAWRQLGSEIAARLLSPREEARVGFVLAHAAAEIQERIKIGETLRDDGFFDPQKVGRSDAEEVAESVLLTSQREPEEKKLPYMAHLLANLAFDSTIGVHMAHQVTNAAEQLTYRQLCILRLATVKHRFALRDTDYRDQPSFSRPLYQILYECLHLYNDGYISFGGEVALGLTDTVPGNMDVQGLGVDIFNLMRLYTIPESEIAPIVAVLK